MKTPVVAGSQDKQFEMVDVLDADGNVIATCYPETASELVNIINAHEKLVEALEKITKYADDEKLQYPYRVGAMKEVAAFALESSK